MRWEVRDERRVGMSTNKTAKNDTSSHKKKERTCRNGDSLSRHRRMNFASGTLADIASPLQSYTDDRSHPRSTSIDTSREENHLNIRCEVRDERRVGVSTNKTGEKRCEFAQKEGAYRNTHLNAVLIFLSTLFLYYAIGTA